MNAWVNIVVSPDDDEIAVIDRIERALGEMPSHVLQVRELITRFEICHFKYQQHYRHIVESIAAMRPVVDVGGIGANHPRHPGDAWRNDVTGRSRAGQGYISALRHWLGEDTSSLADVDGDGMPGTRRQIDALLGDRSEAKDRLVRMLLARLLWHSVAEYRRGGELSGLELQIEATDICNYAFPRNLEKVLQGIGRLEAVQEFDGCGTCDSGMRAFVSTEFSRLCGWLGADNPSDDVGLGRKEPMKVWLVACLAKTMKEDVHLPDRLPELVLGP